MTETNLCHSSVAAADGLRPARLHVTIGISTPYDWTDLDQSMASVAVTRVRSCRVSVAHALACAAISGDGAIAPRRGGATLR